LASTKKTFPGEGRTSSPIAAEGKSKSELLARLEHWRSNSDTDKGKLPLSPRFYACEEMLQMEIEKIFQKEWLCVGHISELKNPGDYLTFDLVGHPIMVVRDRSHELRAFSNVCRHRSARLLDGSGNTKLLVCPYHAWTYELNGKLRGAPFMEPAQVKDICLNDLQLEVWQGLIFVNLDQNTEPLAPRLESLQEEVGQFNLAGMEVVHFYDDEVACNWKVLVENFCESYHVFRVHKTTLEPDTPTASVEVMSGGPGYNHHTMRCVTAAAATKDRDNREHLSCIYPSMTFAVRTASIIWLSIQPLTYNRLRLRAWVAKDPSAGRATETDLEKEMELVAAFMGEDKVINTGVQKGLESGVGNRGPLNELERTNWQFAHFIADKLLD
jgi:phenylpropionate dioxygenase-like ring-hydroxylating dioxygenase large terminal subunit